jgi:hypothetical protein
MPRARGGSSRKCRAPSWPPEPAVSKNGAKADRFTARLTIDVTPELRGRIKVQAFQRAITVAEMLRDLLTREFPDNPGGTA